MDDLDTSQVEEDNQETTTINFKPSFVLIGIDTHSSMFDTKQDEDGNETHHFKDALTACYEIADSLIFSTSKSNYNQFGIVLADQDQKATFVEVQNNLLDTVKLLKKECLKSNEDLKTQYQRQTDIDLASFFLLCKKKFKDINAAYYKRTLIYITNDDNPLKGDNQKKFAALNEVKTFEPSDITLELITMKDTFDYSKFYNELFHLYSKPPVADVVCQDKDGLVEKLSSSIVFRYTKIRYNFYPFKYDKTRFLKVIKANFIREAKLYNTHKASTDGRMLIKVKADPTLVNQEAQQFKIIEGLTLDLKDKYDIFGNDLPLGLHLQYVSNRQTDVGIVINQLSVLFLNPKEELGDYFDQFWQYCVEKNKVLVCLKKYSHPSEIRYVELIPKYANNQKLFLIKDIPFAQELKIGKDVMKAVSQTNNNSGKQIAAIKQLIDKLTHDYDPRAFPNPSYGKKKAYVKAKLLDEPEEEFEDPTDNVEGINEHLKEVITNIERSFGIDGGLQSQNKRKATGSAGSSRGRKVAK
ncbi:unnamed protein product [Ceutorhynchus assimilis]|uniref:Ku70/Ku80 N-terminal alpha/beta domain-containing protein n=1 Tax=Ceutorhynchus assimilis TaxID=467358 RepID=A0A9N9MRN8_9CUCU|nr:unnamed protein product [Ceutorhynchus assimilis]